VLIGIGVEVGLLTLFMYLPPLQRVFGVSPIHPHAWGVLLVFPLLLFFAEEARKLAVRRVWRAV
jgi:hypothetical protein